MRERSSGLLAKGIDLLMLWGVAGTALGSAAGWIAYRMLKRRQSLPYALRTAIRLNRLFVHYQPIVDMSTARIVGVEALARWNHGQESVSPAVFVPIAEQYGLIQPLTESVIHKTLDELAPPC